MPDARDMVACCHWNCNNTIQLLMVPASTVNGEDLGGWYCRDCIFLFCCIYPPSVPPNCDIYRTNFSISHALDYKNGFPVKTCHNDLRDRIANLDGKSFTPLHMRHNPFIQPDCVLWDGNDQLAPSYDSNQLACWYATEHEGDLLIWNLCQRGMEIIHNMHVVNTDNLSYPNKSPDKCIQTAKTRRSGNTWRLTSSNAANYPLSSSLLAFSLAWRPRLRWNA